MLKNRTNEGLEEEVLDVLRQDSDEGCNDEVNKLRSYRTVHQPAKWILQLDGDMTER